MGTRYGAQGIARRARFLVVWTSWYEAQWNGLGETLDGMGRGGMGWDGELVTKVWGGAI